MHRPARGPKRLRKKVVATGSDEDEEKTEASTAGPPPAGQGSAKANGSVKPAAATAAARRTTTKLSFNEEVEEEEAFAKPKAGRKLLQGKRQDSSPAPKKPVPVAVMQRSAAGEYTPEKLAELRKNSKTIYFSSGVRPSLAPPDWPVAMEAEISEVIEPDDGAIPPHQEPQRVRGMDVIDVDDDEEEIPSRTEISKARIRRERIRELGQFVPLEETSYSTELDPEELHSRLVREGEEDPEPEIFDDEKGGRIAFGDPKERERRHKANLLEQIKQAEEEDSEDEEIRRWELEQIKKGVRGGKELRKAALEKTKGRRKEDIAANDAASTKSQISVPEHARGVLSSRTQMPSVEEVQKSLKQALERLEVSHDNEEKELRQVKSSISTAESNAEALRKQLNATSEDFDYYQRLRDYLLDLLDCLKETSGEIEHYNQQSEALILGRYAQRRDGHYLDVQDRIGEIEQGRGDLAEGDPETLARRAERKARRLARADERRQRLAGRTARVEDEEGWSSDEESEQERAQFVASRDDILARASGVFQDVHDEFASLSAIKQRFEEWREEHSAGYYKCFAGVSLVDICVPFVKLQTLAWDPLAPDSVSFEDLEWYRTLSSFGARSHAGAVAEKKQQQQQQQKDEEKDLVPSLVRRWILPKARAFISSAWDPRSRQQTRRVQSLVGDLLVYLPAQADLKTLLQAVMVGLQKALEHVRLANAYLGLSGPARELAMSQFWNAVKLIGNITSWHEQLSNRALRVMAMDKLLNGQVVPFLRHMKFPATQEGISRFVEINEKVLDAFPKHWLVPEREEGMVVPEARLYHGWATQQWRTFKQDGPADLPKELLNRLAQVFARLNDLDVPRQVLGQ